MKIIVRAVGNGERGSAGDVLAEVSLKRGVAQEDLDFLRAKMELAFAELHEQQVAARYDFEEQVKGAGMVFAPHAGAVTPTHEAGPVDEHLKVMDEVSFADASRQARSIGFDLYGLRYQGRDGALEYPSVLE